jgi:hypothetical protein
MVVPDDGRDDEEVLKRTVELVSHADVAPRPAAFQQMLALLEAKGLREETIVGEFEDLLVDFNASVRRHTKARRARLGIQLVTMFEGTAALWAPPAALATGPSAAAGEALIKRRWGDTAEASLGALSLLAQARRALRC